MPTEPNNRNCRYAIYNCNEINRVSRILYTLSSGLNSKQHLPNNNTALRTYHTPIAYNIRGR